MSAALRIIQFSLSPFAQYLAADESSYPPSLTRDLVQSGPLIVIPNEGFTMMVFTLSLRHADCNVFSTKCLVAYIGPHEALYRLYGSRGIFGAARRAESAL